MRKLRIPYWYLLLGPSLLFWLGLGLNALVMALNKNQMPVLWVSGVCTPQTRFAQDLVHVCMTAGTRLKFLADWAFQWTDVPGVFSIYSVGDALIGLGDATRVPLWCAWVALVIRDKSSKE